jgi:hypothetical protein
VGPGEWNNEITQFILKEFDSHIFEIVVPTAVGEHSRIELVYVEYEDGNVVARASCALLPNGEVGSQRTILFVRPCFEAADDQLDRMPTTLAIFSDAGYTSTSFRTSNVAQKAADIVSTEVASSRSVPQGEDIVLFYRAGRSGGGAVSLSLPRTMRDVHPALDSAAASVDYLEVLFIRQLRQVTP